MDHRVIVVVEAFLFLSLCSVASASVVLIRNNLTLSFDDVEANFAPPIKGSGERGVLYIAEPLDACSNLTNKVDKVSNYSSPFLLIIRGTCSFEEKVKKAQEAGFKVAIVYDDEEGGLVAMSGNSAGIEISAVFVAKSTGETLMKYAGLFDSELWIIPSFENSAWSILAISFISLLAMSAVLATCFFVRRHRIRRDRPHPSRVREFHVMSRRLVKAMPSLTFTAILGDNSTSGTCAICLEDYSIGDKLRILPCRHKFHAACVDSWLTTWRTFCPVCKRDARTSTGDPPASECTPLLLSSPASVSSSLLSSFRSTTSSAIQVASSSYNSQSISRIPSVSSTPYIHQSILSRHQSPSLGVSRSSANLRNMSSPRIQTSHLVSPHSFGYPSISPINSRYLSPYIPSPSNASPGLVGSSSHRSRLLHCSESAVSFSPYNSAHSLPEC